MAYQNPTKFEDTIGLAEFDLPRNGTGNHYLTYVEWTDKNGKYNYGSTQSDEYPIPDYIRLQIALQIAGDLIQPKE